MIVEIEELVKGHVPEFKHAGDAGADCKSTVDITLMPLSRAKVKLGFKCKIPLGYEMQIRPRSGASINFGISIINSPGTVDSGYGDEVAALVINLDPNDSFRITKGMRICQAVIQKLPEVEYKVVGSIKVDNNRGGGFGSSGYFDQRDTPHSKAFGPRSIDC